MYKNFILKKNDKGKIAGYLWSVDNPDKIVVIIHGIGEYGGRFDRVAEEFKKHNMACLAIDLRGHGMSMNSYGHCAPRADVLRDISDLIEYARDLYGQKDIILYGHSMGGNIVLDYRCRGSLNYVPSGYIISAPWVKLVKAVPAPVVKLVGVLKNIAPAFTIGSDVDEDALGHPESVGLYHGNPLVHNKISFETAYDGFTIGMKLYEGKHENNGRADNIPMLLMHGTADSICDISGSRAVARNMKECGQPIEYIEWEGLYHEIHNGNKSDKGDKVIRKAVEWAKNL